MSRVSAALFAASLLVTPAAAQTQQNAFADAWRDNMVEQIETAYVSLQRIQTDVVRLQSELEQQGNRVAPGGKCGRLDCGDLDAMARLAASGEAAALTTYRLNEIALKQRQRQADAAAKIASAIRKGKNTLEWTLWAQQVAQGIAELSINIGVAMATGDPEAVTSAVQKVAAATANFAANKAIDRTTGIASGAGDRSAAVVETLGGGAMSQSVASSLSSQLTRIGVFDTQASGAASKFVFRPQLFLKTLTKSDAIKAQIDWIKRDGERTIRTIKSVPAVVDTVARTVLAAVTGPAIGQTEEFVKRARQELRQAVDDQKVYVEAATMQAVYTRTARKIWRNHQLMREGIDRLRADCHTSVRRGNCAERLNAVLKSAETEYASRTKEISARRKRRGPERQPGAGRMAAAHGGRQCHPSRTFGGTGPAIGNRTFAVEPNPYRTTRPWGG